MALLTIGDQFPAYNLTAVIGGGLFAGILRSRLLLPGCMFVTLPALSPGRKPVLSHAVSFHPSAVPAGEGPGSRR